MTITSPHGNWIHESSWDPEHAAFAAKCPCFSGSDLQRLTWASKGGRGRPTPLGTSYWQAGRWLLQNPTTHDFLAAASLQWEAGLFNNAWLFFSDMGGAAFAGETNPAFWLVEAIFQRLTPDVMTLHGSSWIHALQDIGELKTVAAPNQELSGFEKTTIVRIDRMAWLNFPAAAACRKELDWIRRQVARENRDQEFAARPSKRPFLLRILLALSPMRGRRSSKMVHPIDRLKRHLA